MAKWTDYTTDTNPTDTDEVMILDADKSPKANKRVTLSTLADYFLDKLASKVFAKLDTQNKTVIGALNELNSKAKSGIIYSSPVTFKLSNSSIYILICAHSSGKPVISVFTTYDNKILQTQLSEPSFAKIEVSGMNIIVTAQYTHIYSLVKVS